MIQRITTRARVWGSLFIVVLIVTGCFGRSSQRSERGASVTVIGTVYIDSGWNLGAAAGVTAPSSHAPVFHTAPMVDPWRVDEITNPEVDQFIIEVRPGTTAATVQAIARRYGFTYVRSSGEAFHVLEAPGLSLAEVRAALMDEYEIVYVEPNGRMVLLELIDELRPNDPYLQDGSQWTLEAMRFPMAWAALRAAGVDLETREDIVVAVIDTGIDFTHQDLADPQMWVPGRDFTRDGSHGVHYDFNSGDTDAGSHGTLVASIIGALTNDGKGMAGAAWGKVKMMPIRVFASDNSTTDRGIVADAIEWAVDYGANVINLSLGNAPCSDPGCDDAKDYRRVKAALQKAWDHNIPVIVAAGNDGSDVYFPAYDERTIAVGAITYTAHPADFNVPAYSSRGPELNVVAPGGASNGCGGANRGVFGATYQMFKRDQYGCGHGTSFAAPHVTAVVALMLARGNVESPLEAMRLLEMTARRRTPGFDETEGWGMVDAYGAVSAGIPLVFPGTEHGGTLTMSAPPVKALGAGGAFVWNGYVEGTPTIYAWVDADQSGTVNESDYFGNGGPIVPVAGRTYGGFDIVLTRYEGEPLVVVDR